MHSRNKSAPILVALSYEPVKRCGSAHSRFHKGPSPEYGYSVASPQSACEPSHGADDWGFHATSTERGPRRPRGLTIGVLIGAVALAACDWSDCGSGSDFNECIKGSGKVVSQDRKVDPFTAIELDSIGDLTVERTGTDSLTVTTDDNLQPIVTAEVKDGTLVLAESKCHNCSPTKIFFKVTVSDLRKIDMPSTGSAAVSKLDEPGFTADMSGTGSLKLSGKTGTLKVDLSGTGSCDAHDLAAKSAAIDLSGTGSVRVNASDELKADLSGTGSIRYAGSPKLTQKVSGTGAIKHE